eukprot:m.13804 g.13804  ORF g.13804 m.13804 type:complete len:319 (+) comp6030_c1_seq1:152-1108(+)
MTTTTEYYKSYYGHSRSHLEIAHDELRKRNKSIAFFVGDSTLDNKHWLFNPARGKVLQMASPLCTAAALPQYGNLFGADGRMVKDVAYWTTRSLGQFDVSAAALNCAVEESTIGERETELFEQDYAMEELLTDQDYLVVSMGGNDVALKPSVRTIKDVLFITRCRKEGWFGFIHRRGISCLTRRFSSGIVSYLRRVLSTKKPKGLVICALYYPAVVGSGWADTTLRLIKYDETPEPMQAVIREVYDGILAHVQEAFPDIPIRLCKMYEALDPTNAVDYVQRVEPSVEGGEKIGQLIAQTILDIERNIAGAATTAVTAK